MQKETDEIVANDDSENNKNQPSLATRLSLTIEDKPYIYDTCESVKSLLTNR